MKYLLLTLCITTLVACSNNKSVLSDAKVGELKTFFETNVKESDSTIANVDSFAFVRLDTMTEKIRVRVQIDELNYKLSNLLQLNDLTLQLYKTKLNTAKLTSEISPDLAKMKLDEADVTRKETEKNLQTAKDYENRIKTLSEGFDKTDSVKGIGFQAVCSYQVRKKDQSVVKDTAYIMLNPDKNIVQRNKFFQLD